MVKALGELLSDFHSASSPPRWLVSGGACRWDASPGTHCLQSQWNIQSCGIIRLGGVRNPTILTLRVALAGWSQAYVCACDCDSLEVRKVIHLNRNSSWTLSDIPLKQTHILSHSSGSSTLALHCVSAHPCVCSCVLFCSILRACCTSVTCIGALGLLGRSAALQQRLAAASLQ